VSVVSPLLGDLQRHDVPLRADHDDAAHELLEDAVFG